MSAEQSPLLLVQDLTIGFGQAAPVVQDVSFELQSGQTMGLIGRSGSGKSMVAHAIAGLLPSAAVIRGGSIDFLDFKVARSGEAPDEIGLRAIRGKQIGMIFQEPQSSLNPTTRCGQQLLEALTQYFPARSRTELGDLALEWLNKVRLPNGSRIMRAYPNELSGGQQQRLLIAMAMAAEPRLLLADEPTTALDTVTELEILKLLRRLTEELGSALLFISHDLAVVKYLAEDVIVLDHGKVIARGKTESIIKDPPNERVEKLIAGSARLQFSEESIDSRTKGGTEPATPSDLEPGRADLPTKKAKPETDWAVRIENLSYNYVTKRNFFGRVTAIHGAVNNVSLELAKGEFTALVGESGCGKTTLGRCLNGLLPAYSGRIRLADERPQTVQTVFQDPSATLNPSMSVAATLKEVVRFHQPQLAKYQVKDIVADLLLEVGLPADEYGSRYPDELSGGQKQRIAIARALAAKPSLLICDEAVSALDAELQIEILQLLGELRRSTNLTILFISHDLALVMRYADRIAVMDAGELAEVTTPKELKTGARSERGRALLAAAALN
ncbi:ABC transporter ATP-binding protein [Lewinellaceae bacterium SD302]|nr:ABC transporter ATP-binding protein [Lewinellaceae bacterium SD302]